MEAQLPRIDPSTLQHLTKTIEGNLKKPVGKPPKPPRQPRAKREQKPIEPDHRSKNLSSVAVKSSSGSKDQDARKKKKPEGGKNEKSADIRSSVNTIKLGSKPENHVLANKSRLEEEVLALGGGKDDFDLIADVESESEMEETSAPASNRLQHGLKKDLHRLVMDLGISNLEKRELSSSSEAEDPQDRSTERRTTAHQAQGIPSMKAMKKQPRNVAAKGPPKLVILIRGILCVCLSWLTPFL